MLAAKLAGEIDAILPGGQTLIIYDGHCAWAVVRRVGSGPRLGQLSVQRWARGLKHLHREGRWVAFDPRAYGKLMQLPEWAYFDKSEALLDSLFVATLRASTRRRPGR